MKSFSEFQDAVLPSNPVDRKAIVAAIQEISGSMTRVEGERDYQKEAIADIAEKYEIDKKIMRKLVRMYHAQSKEQVKSETDLIVETYDALFQPTKE